MDTSIRDINEDFLNKIDFKNAGLGGDLTCLKGVNNETSFTVEKILEYSSKFDISLEKRKISFIIKEILKCMLNSEDDTEHLLAKHIQSNRKIIKGRRRSKQLEQENEKLRELATTDNLTNIANRRGLNQEIIKQIELKK